MPDQITICCTATAHAANEQVPRAKRAGNESHVGRWVFSRTLATNPSGTTTSDNRRNCCSSSESANAIVTPRVHSHARNCRLHRAPPLEVTIGTAPRSDPSLLLVRACLVRCRFSWVWVLWLRVVRRSCPAFRASLSGPLFCRFAGRRARCPLGQSRARK